MLHQFMRWMFVFSISLTSVFTPLPNNPARPDQPSPVRVAATADERLELNAGQPASERQQDFERHIAPHDFIPLAAGTPQTITIELTSNTLIANSAATATITATAYDLTGTPLPDVILSGVTSPPTLGPVSGLGTTNASGQVTGTWTAGGVIGNGTLNIGDGTFTETASISLTTGALATITVLPNPITLAVATTHTFSASGYDQHLNPVSIAPGWSSNGGAIDASGVFTAQTTVANGKLITATQGAISGTAIVNLTAGQLNKIVVAPNPVTVTVGTTHVFTASGFDQYTNTVSITPGWSSNGGTIDASGLFTANTIAAANRVVTATQGAISGTAIVNLVPDAPFTLTLTPATAVISAGVRLNYTAVATDVFGNSIGPVTGNTTFSIAPGAGGTFAGNAITPTIRGTWIITGVNGAAVSTATLTVTPAALFTVTIQNGSGNPIGNVPVDLYSPLAAYAAGYDRFNNSIGLISATWGGTGVVAGNLAPTTGISTTFTPVVSGTGTITATSGTITDTTGIITVQGPELRISKTASPDPLTPGSPLQYTLVYTNIGNAAAQNVIVTETYPLSATFSYASPPPTGGNNVWSIGTMAIGEVRTIVVSLTTPSQMLVGSVLTNTVRVGAAKITSFPYTLTTQVNALPNLSVSLFGPNSVRPGEPLAYGIQYRNDGTAPVTNVRITETYPAQVTFVSATPAPNITPTVWLTNSLNGNGGTGFIFVTVGVSMPLTDSTILNNAVTVSAQEAPPYTTNQQILIIAPRLQLSKSASSDTPQANSLLTYTLNYANIGSSYAANTTITDAVPANTTYVQCLPSGCGVNNGIVTWNPGRMEAHTSGVVTLTVNITNNLPNGVVITNTARINTPETFAAATLLTSTVSSLPDLVLTESDGAATAAANDLLTYVLTYTNSGTAPANRVVITDRIPNNVAFAGCSACTVMGGGVYSFTLNTVNAAQTNAVTLSVRVNTSLPAGLRAITNTATIMTSTPGDNTNNNTMQDVDLISTVPVLALQATYNSNTPYPGKTITYTLRYTNTSAMDTTGVVISVTRSSFITVTPPGWIAVNGFDTWPIGNLPAGQPGVAMYTITLPLTYTTAMTAFVNAFLIHDNGPGGLAVAQDTEPTSVGVPDLIIDHVNVPLSVVAGQNFTATVIIRNAGLGRACNPNGCGGFYLDTFIDPAVPPPSYPYQADGFPYAGVPAVAPGQVMTITIPNIVYTTQGILYFKVDNFNCRPNGGGDPCLPSHSLGGLVPEYNEFNNIAGPIALLGYTVYLPAVLKNR